MYCPKTLNYEKINKKVYRLSHYINYSKLIKQIYHIKAISNTINCVRIKKHIPLVWVHVNTLYPMTVDLQINIGDICLITAIS